MRKSPSFVRDGPYTNCIHTGGGTIGSGSVQACSSDGVCSDLDGSAIAASALQAWSDAGIERWALGAEGASCDTTCSAAGLSCSTDSNRFPGNLGADVTEALFEAAGHDCGSVGTTSSNMITAPYYYPDPPYFCYWTSVSETDPDTPQCDTTKSDVIRLCPCGRCVCVCVCVRACVCA